MGFRLLTAGLLLALGTGAAVGQEDQSSPFSRYSASDLEAYERGLEQDYLNKLLTLRHFDRRNRIEVNPEGEIKGEIKSGPWTTHGKIEIEDIEVQRERVEFRGRRVWAVWDKKKDDFRYLGTQREVLVRFELPKSGLDVSKLEHAFLQVFLGADESMADFAPLYWQPFLRGETLDAETAIARSKEQNFPFELKQHRWSLKTPPEAEAVGISGQLVLLITVRRDGKIEKPVIVQPLGLGMDEAFLDALEKLQYEVPDEKAALLPLQKLWAIEFTTEYR